MAFTGKERASSFFLLIFIFFFWIWEAWISIYSICLDDALHLFFLHRSPGTTRAIILFVDMDIGGRLPQSVFCVSFLLLLFFFSIFFYSFLTLASLCLLILFISSSAFLSPTRTKTSMKTPRLHHCLVSTNPIYLFLLPYSFLFLFYFAASNTGYLSTCCHFYYPYCGRFLSLNSVCERDGAC